MIFAEYASPTPGRAFNSAAEAVLMSTRPPCEGAGEVASGVATLAGAVALGLAGAVFPVGEVDWANTGKAITSARIAAPKREIMSIVSLRLCSGKSYGWSIDDQISATRFMRFPRPTPRSCYAAAHGPARRDGNAAGAVLSPESR